MLTGLRIWMHTGRGPSQSWDSNFQVRTQNISVRSDAALDTSSFGNRGQAVLGSTDTGRHHTNWDTGESGSQDFILCILNWTQGPTEPRETPWKWGERGWLSQIYFSTGWLLAVEVALLPRWGCKKLPPIMLTSVNLLPSITEIWQVKYIRRLIKLSYFSLEPRRVYLDLIETFEIIGCSTRPFHKKAATPEPGEMERSWQSVSLGWQLVCIVQ